MNKLCIIILAIVTVLLCFGCETNEFIPPPPKNDLYGFYTGGIEINDNGLTDSVTNNLEIYSWVFTNTRIWCEIDTLSNEPILCDFSGDYSLTGSFNIELDSNNCNNELTPAGSFDCLRKVYENAPDTLVLHQIKDFESRQIETSIKLVRVEES